MPARVMSTAYHERILDAIRHVEDNLDGYRELITALPAAEPNRLRAALGTISSAQVIVTGTLDRRLLLLQHPGGDQWTAADLSGQPHQTRNWPVWARPTIHLDVPASWLSTATLSAEALDRLTRPTVLLAALYHPEYFPLPRFPLAISDLARAARSALTGQIELMDMQFSVTLDEIVATVATNRPDILGVSATFGQHDLLVRLLDSVAALPHTPLVLAGGSLTARNERLLLERYPWLLIARGAQLESSRGCTNFCSFCPRGHKGSWAGTDPTALPWIVRAMGEVFDRYPEISRTLYLVDEEFIGRGPDATSRALAVADVSSSSEGTVVPRPAARTVWLRGVGGAQSAILTSSSS